jgi:hypothetical protein
MNNFAAALEREKRPHKSKGGPYTSDSFRPINNNPSQAVNKIKTKFAAIESQTLSYRRRFSEMPTGARAKSAPAYATPFASTTQQLLHLPGMNGHIPARVQNNINFQAVRQLDKKVKHFGMRTLLRGPEEDLKKYATVNIDSKSIQRDFNAARSKYRAMDRPSRELTEEGLSNRVETGWNAAKVKVNHYRDQDIATEYLSVLADDESKEDEMLDVLEELAELARSEGIFTIFNQIRLVFSHAFIRGRISKHLVELAEKIKRILGDSV